MSARSSAKVIYTCSRCGKESGRLGRFIHTYLEWPWWRPFDKSGPRRCLRAGKAGPEQA